MTIGFDGSRAFIKNRTGTENYSYQLLRALSKIDYKNQYIIYLRSPGLALQGWPKNFNFKVISFSRLWTQVGLAERTFKNDLDVLFVPAHTLPVIHKPGLKTVITVHDLGAEYLPKMHQLKQQLYLKYITKYQLRSSSKLIAVSKATKEDLVNRIGIDPEKIKVVYEGYNEKLFKLTTKLSLGGKIDTVVDSLKPYYLFVGTVQPRKNLERLIRAFAFLIQGPAGLLSPLTLVIAGSKGWLSGEIYELPKKLGIENRVKFLGYMADEKLPALYSEAQALVFPSLFEGFGLPILEAQASGCPVLTSNISSMPEVAGLPAGRGAILVDPYSVDDIVNGMKRLEDRKLRLEIIKEGFVNIKRFSWEKCAKETLKVLESV